LIISTSRIAPDVRSPKTKTRPVAGRLERGSSQSEGRRGSSAGRTARLTRREQQIVNLLLEGCDNTEIAGHLRIAQRTVKAYFNRLFLRFGITSGIKRVKLATFMYRSHLCSDMIFSSDAQLNGNSASSPSASVTGTPLAKLEPPSTSSRTVFGPSTTSWVCGTVSSLPYSAGRGVATAGRTLVGAREPGIFPSGQLMPAKPGGCVGTWMFLTRAYK
jgi:DNA-binding CsgD family transcriptional regulator